MRQWRRPAPDAVVERRVRRLLERVASHPDALSARAQNGHVTLSGPVLALEAGPLLSAVCRVRGVEKVVDRLEVHESAKGIPALEASRPRPQDVAEAGFPLARLALAAVGGGLFAWGAVRRDWRGAAAGAVGLGLLVRGIKAPAPRADAEGDALFEVHKVLTVAAPRERVFDLWTRAANFPRFLSGVQEVRPLGGGRLRWIVSGPAGLPVGWDTELTLFVPGYLLAWRSLPGSAVRNAGTLHFDDTDAGGTRVSVQISYQPPEGALGRMAATLFGTASDSPLEEDLRRTKAAIESETARGDVAPVH
jgi:uncharacterized membrane protein